MTDNIWGRRFFERDNAGKNQRAWHQLGTVGDPSQPMTVLEAVRAADVDYGVVTVPLFFKSPTDNEIVQSEQVAIVRPAWRGEPEHIYGYASNEYHPLQNFELAQMLEPLAEQWPVETVGAIRQGADLFVTLFAGKRQIGGDEVDQYFFVWNSHDGSSALRVRVTPVRVVCQNTCILGDRRATIAMDVRHTRQIIAEAQMAFDLVAQLQRAEDTTMAALSRLTTFRLNTEQVRQVFEAAYPIHEDTDRIRFLEAHTANLSDEQIRRLEVMKANLEGDRAKMLKRQLAALERYDVFNQQYPTTARTGWAAYNAVTEVECWRQGGSDKQAATSILMGDRGAAMARAYEALVTLQ